MQRNNVWELEVYPLSDFKTRFNGLRSQSKNEIIELIRELVLLPDPEDHVCSLDCPGIQGFNHAVKYVTSNNSVLLVALDRLDTGNHVTRVITLFSCSD